MQYVKIIFLRVKKKGIPKLNTSIYRFIKIMHLRYEIYPETYKFSVKLFFARIQFIVTSFLFEKLFVRSAFYNFTGFEHHDRVCVADG